MSQPEVIDLLETLVAIDSSNPSLGEGAGEGEIAEFVVDWAEDNGLAVRTYEGTPGRPSVVIRGGRDRGGRRLLLCGHLDTVGLADMGDPLTPRREGDRLYGRGTYDMKAGLAALLIACRDAHRADVGGEVVVAAVADEEFASLGIREIIPDLDADAAVVAEPTELEIAIAHRGFVWIEIEVLGKAAHGSRPHLGVDAITKTGPVLVALDELNRQLRSRPHPLLDPANVHASLIAGGVEESTIPGRCVLTIERRTLPGESAEDIESEMAELLEACEAADNEMEATSRITMVRQPLETPPDAEIVKFLGASTRIVLGEEAEIGAVSYWADSAFISEAGIPTVLFGPSGDGAHASEEWVSLESTVACAGVFSDLAIVFCC